MTMGMNKTLRILGIMEIIIGTTIMFLGAATMYVTKKHNK